MSWAISFQDKSVAEARDFVTGSCAPDSVKAYLSAGIDGLVAVYGEDVRVASNSYGHVCTGVGSYEVTSATITLSKHAEQTSLNTILGTEAA